MNGLKAVSTLCLTLVFFKTIGAESVEECFSNTEYISCSSNREGFPETCDCEDKEECYFKLTITRTTSWNEEKQEVVEEDVFVNGQLHEGPTLIVKENATVVVDVFNEMNVTTSIHFHGMHQWNTPWMDGVASITQWPVQPNGSFRHIFKALPSGTHWYHSHVKLQRDNGLVGAFIVKEKNDKQYPESTVDHPGDYTILITERFRPKNKSTGKRQVDGRKRYCLPDGSALPNSHPPSNFDVFVDGSSKAEMREFHVVQGNVYRFRLIGATLVNAILFSIDRHKLTVVATDGYLVERFETDFIIVHIGERYDFLLNTTLEPGTKVSINFQSLEIACDTNEFANEASAQLVYEKTGRGNNPNNETPDPCSSTKPCTVLNCPFKEYNETFGMLCVPITNLTLYNPTPPNRTPNSNNINFEGFFNFYKINDVNASINSIHLKTLPSHPLQVTHYNEKEDNICMYNDSCFSGKDCIHIVDIPSDSRNNRFVLTSIGEKLDDPRSATTHPVHFHGHSFSVAKIAYPEYHDNGTIKEANRDLILNPDGCGPPRWNGIAPVDISTTNTTVRKDTVVVPAGGYVVIEFLGDNPGYWFMHCHIDYHLMGGMAIVVRERKICQNPPPDDLKDNITNFCWNISAFEKKLDYHFCPEVPEETKTEGQKTTESSYTEAKEEPDQKFLHQHQSPDDLMDINNRRTGSFKRTKHTKRTKRTQGTKRAKRTQRTQRTQRTNVNRHQEMRELRKQSRQKQRIEDDWLGFDGIPEEPLMSHF